MFRLKGLTFELQPELAKVFCFLLHSPEYEVFRSYYNASARGATAANSGSLPVLLSRAWYPTHMLRPVLLQAGGCHSRRYAAQWTSKPHLFSDEQCQNIVSVDYSRLPAAGRQVQGSLAGMTNILVPPSILSFCQRDYKPLKVKQFHMRTVWNKNHLEGPALSTNCHFGLVV